MWKRDFYVRLNANTYVSTGIITDSCKFADDLDKHDDLYRQWV